MKIETDPEGFFEFRGHNYWGDGSSYAAFLILPATLIAALSMIPPTSLVSSVLSLLLYTSSAIWMILIAVSLSTSWKIRFGNRNSAAVSFCRKSLLGTWRTWLPPEKLTLKVSPIHIRLAPNCGAVDLLTPVGSIRIAVEGDLSAATSLAHGISEKSGIKVENS